LEISAGLHPAPLSYLTRIILAIQTPSLNLHQVLNQIEEMMKSSDDMFSAEAQDEFTRLQVYVQHRISGEAVLIGFQVFSLEFREQRYTYLSAYAQVRTPDT